MNNFLFVAAENDGLYDCKAGGMGDVVRDVPRQIASRGDRVHVVVPSYGRLHSDGKLLGELAFELRGMTYYADIYEAKPKKDIPGITHYVIDHPEIEAGDIADIYHIDETEPFYTDFTKFVIFGTAVAEAIASGYFGDLEIVHLHDWHTSILLFLREYHPNYKMLKDLRLVYTIHNLAIQGIRPFTDNYSSLENWYPDVAYEPQVLWDERYPDCINLMAVGIRLSNTVHAVSPSYKKEVLKASNPPAFIGGESLEKDLKKANKEGRLFGILNGCNYSNIRVAEKNTLYRLALKTLFQWGQMEDKQYKSHFLAHTGEKVAELLLNPPSFVCSSVARLTEQKFYFFMYAPDALREILKKLERVNGIMVILGTGIPQYEEMLRKMSRNYKNLIFINGQSEDVIDAIYLETDLYFMPSMFEPCGISQMLAMRNGHPCLVHKTGGLIDTVKHMKTGFHFDGDTLDEKIENMVDSFDMILDLYQNDRETWEEIRAQAKKQRFTWKRSVTRYYKYLYGL